MKRTKHPFLRKQWELSERIGWQSRETCRKQQMQLVILVAILE